ncbi:hypothetical protein K1719_009133 [Acacia pycnantha]|nr:hypothetical protein K1719_009133 [Acacia pycnantha]
MAIAIADNNEEERMRNLYDAALKGCVLTLNTLLQQDPSILHRVSSQTTFFETPLHKSALLGHLEFTKTLLAHYPKLALEPDSSQRTPLHFASAEGPIDIVKELLKACGEACFVRDQEHRIPLHYAVIRGRRDVVLELIRAKPESLMFRAEKGKNILHLCVMYNHLEILKELVDFPHYDTNNLLIEGDSDGKNTILHLATILKQFETVRYLVSIPKIRSEASNLKNDMGDTAADIVKRIPKDSKSFVIRKNEDGSDGPKKCSWSYVLESIDNWLRYKGNWVAEMRGNLSLVATFLASISFQAITNPPGGVIQQGIRPSDPNFNPNSSSKISFSQGPLGCLNHKYEIGNSGSHLESCPGKAMLAYRDPHNFEKFIMYNTISFAVSLIVVLLLVSGVPLRDKVVVRLLSIGMTMAVTCLLNAFFSGLTLIAPHIWLIDKVVVIATWTLNGLNILIAMYVGAACIRWVKDRWVRNRNVYEAQMPAMSIQV